MFKMARAQSSIEFMILVGFLLFSFIVFLGVISQNTAQKSSEIINAELYDVALTLKSEIDMAYNSLDGYKRTFEIPMHISRREYLVSVEKGIASVKTVDGKHSLGVPIKNVTGVVNLGTNTIRKENGIVTIN